MPGERDLTKLEENIALYSDSKSSTNLLDKVCFWRKPKRERLLKELQEYYDGEKKNQFYHLDNKRWVRNGLEREMSMILGGKKEQIRVSLFEDSDYILSLIHI